MEDQEILLKWNSHHTTFNHVISSLRGRKSYTDVTLACNGKFYSLHKFVLAICSEYLCEIFEITECTVSMIILTGIQCSDLEILLDYMYTGRVNVQKYKISSVMKAAEFLRIKGLASHEEEPKSLSCSIVSKKQSHPFIGRTGEDKSMHLSSRRTGKEVKDLSITNEGEDRSDIEILSETCFPDNSSSNIEEGNCLSMSDYNDSDLSESSGIRNNAIPPWGRGEDIFTERFSDAVSEKQSPPMKRRRSDIGRSSDFSSIRPCKLMLDPDSSMYYLATETLANDDSCNSITSISHNQDNTIEKDIGPILCKQENCKADFRTLDDLRNHLSNKHEEKHPKIVLSFKAWEDLEKWKQGFEEENVVSFRIVKVNKRKNGKVRYYQCNRSSCFLQKSEATGKRKAKAGLEDGPSQISSLCTAGLIVLENDGTFHVTAYPTHANHPLDSKHKKCLRLPEALKDEYIKQIQMGVPLHVILGGINEEVKEKYRISYNKLYHLKKKNDNRTGISTGETLLSLPASNTNNESDSN